MPETVEGGSLVGMVSPGRCHDEAEAELEAYRSVADSGDGGARGGSVHVQSLRDGSGPVGRGPQYLRVGGTSPRRRLVSRGPSARQRLVVLLSGQRLDALAGVPLRCTVQPHPIVCNAYSDRQGVVVHTWVVLQMCTVRFHTGSPNA